MKVNLSKEFQNDLYINEIIDDLIEKKKNIPVDFPLTLIKDNPQDYKWSPPRLVKIPKSDGNSLRDIYIFNDCDSLLQKIINKILFTKIGNKISKNVYSYTKGLRTYNAVSYIKDGLQSKSLVGYKLDIRNYFLSVPLPIILKSIDDLVEDFKGRMLLHKLFSINSYAENGMIHEKFLSLMPGSAVSAFFANYVLTPIDQVLSTFSEVYARYSDDLVFFCKDINKANDVLNLVRNTLGQIGLTIHPNKIELIDDCTNLEFLGLRIVGNNITISNGTYQNIKDVVREICKSYRTKFEKSSNTNKNSFYYVKQAIICINRKLYKSIFNPESSHKSSRLSYVFANITSDLVLKDFDRFVCQSLNYVFTGKHNRSPNRLSIYQLETLGFYSSVKLFNLYKLDKNLYLNEVYLLNRTLVKHSDYCRRVIKTFISPVEFTEKLSFYELFSKILETPNSTFFFNGINVPAEYVTFDLVSNEVYAQGFSIIKNDSFVVTCLNFMLDDTCYSISTNDMKLIESTNKNSYEPRLLELFIASCFKTDLSIDSNKPYSGFTNFILFRFYPLSELLSKFPEDKLSIYDSFEKRQVRFLSYLFLNLANNNYYSSFNHSYNLNKLGIEGVNLVLNKNTIYKLHK